MIHFRAAEADDAGLISHIHAASWRKKYRDFISGDYLDRLPDDYWVPSLHPCLLSGQMEGLLIYDGKQPSGCACYGRGRDDAYSSWGEIISIYLLPEYMGRGFGSSLLENVLEALRAQGYTRFYLWMLQGNTRAGDFYTRHGFKATDDTVAYTIGGQPVVDVRYVRVEK